jgi:hypothetical protein
MFWIYSDTFWSLLFNTVWSMTIVSHPDTQITDRWLRCHRASALPVRASTASRANVNLNILFIELQGEATARLSTSPSFAGARETVRQKARLPLRVQAV